MSGQTKRTTDHDTIREWAEERNVKPSVISEDGGNTKIIRLDFPGFAKKNLKEISWKKWFNLLVSRLF